MQDFPNVVDALYDCAAVGIGIVKGVFVEFFVGIDNKVTNYIE